MVIVIFTGSREERDGDRHGRDFERAFSYGISGDDEHYIDGDGEGEGLEWEED